MIIIPDIHGRDFWEKPVRENLWKEHIIILVYWRNYEKVGHNPITDEDVTAVRREVYADFEIPKDFVFPEIVHELVHELV